MAQDDAGITGNEGEPEDPNAIGGIPLPSHTEATKILLSKPTYYGVQARTGPMATRKRAQRVLLRQKYGPIEAQRAIQLKRADEARALEKRRLQSPDLATTSSITPINGAGTELASVLIDPFLLR